MQPPVPDLSLVRVVIAAPDEATRRALVEAHEGLGHAVAGLAATGPELVEAALAGKPSVVVVSLAAPGAAEALARLAEQHPCAAVVLGERAARGDIAPLLTLPVYAYLIEPAAPGGVAAAAEFAHRRWLEASAAREENARLQAAVASRKLIERAKGLLMKKHRWGEAEAFRRLQRGAMNRRIPMADLAKQILEGVDVPL